VSGEGGTWAFAAFVSGLPERFRPFFDERGLLDADSWNEAFQQIEVGGETFSLTDTNLYEVQLEELDDDSQPASSRSRRATT
jgi:hypothetical protein